MIIILVWSVYSTRTFYIVYRLIVYIQYFTAARKKRTRTDSLTGGEAQSNWPPRPVDYN